MSRQSVSILLMSSRRSRNRGASASISSTAMRNVRAAMLSARATSTKLVSGVSWPPGFSRPRR
jgi:hypothetical protein